MLRGPVRSLLFPVQEDIDFAAAASGQALPRLGLSVSGYLEAAGWALGGPVKLQLVLRDFSLFSCVAG